MDIFSMILWYYNKACGFAPYSKIGDLEMIVLGIVKQRRICRGARRFSSRLIHSTRPRKLRMPISFQRGRSYSSRALIPGKAGISAACTVYASDSIWMIYRSIISFWSNCDYSRFLGLAFHSSFEMVIMWSWILPDEKLLPENCIINRELSSLEYIHGISYLG